MNAPPSASAISALGVGYEDAFLARNHLGVPTFRVHPAPYLRLDYVFINRDVTALSARRIDREMSDHFAVAADLAIRKGGQ
jgi:endonuclease/exonuclease/phosphatase family metal-dependent hydrolase